MKPVTIPAKYLRWRNGRPRWEPGPTLRAAGYKGFDLKNIRGEWLSFEAAIAALLIDKRIPPAIITTRCDKPAAERSRLHLDNTIFETMISTNVLRGGKMPKRKAKGHYVYVFTAEDRWAKIGFSTNPQWRHSYLSSQVPVPLTFALASPGTSGDERCLHRLFGNYRLNNEWFRIAGDLALWLDDARKTKRPTDSPSDRPTKSEGLCSLPFSFSLLSV